VQEVSVHVTGAGGDAEGALEGGCVDPAPLPGPSGGQTIIGPRIKMGIYEGVPTRVAPHTTTGSADYFGPLVNRYTALLMSPLVSVSLSVCLCVLAQALQTA